VYQPRWAFAAERCKVTARPRGRAAAAGLLRPVWLERSGLAVEHWGWGERAWSSRPSLEQSPDAQRNRDAFMPGARNVGIDPRTFRKIADVYRRRHGLELVVATPAGQAVLSARGRRPLNTRPWRQARRLAVSEAERWGEASVVYGPDHHLVWAVPLMCNQKVLGGLVAEVPEERVLSGRAGPNLFDSRRACTDLRLLAEEHNLTNAALLERRRAECRHEQLRAEAIHDLKLASSYQLRQAYLNDEPELIAAIRAGDRGAARAVLNRLLAAIHFHTGERFELTKTFFMELVATACRTAVEAGGDPEQLLGTNFASISELARVKTLEQLAPWLHQTLERILDCLQAHRFSTDAVLLSRAVEYLQQHFTERLTRDQVARVAHLSPSHFSRQFRRYTGLTFTEALTRLRVQRAAELLVRTDKPLSLIALECGFSDQSYFTKAFRRVMGETPGRYRRRQSEVG